LEPLNESALFDDGAAFKVVSLQDSSSVQFFIDIDSITFT
jgi:hypothetical protein